MFPTSRPTLWCLVFALFLQSFPVFGQLTGTLLPDPLIVLDKGDTGFDFHPSKMDVNPYDGKIYFNSAVENITYRVDEDGIRETVATYGGSAFLLGLQFDPAGNLYVVNAAGLWKVSKDDVLENAPVDLTGTEPLFAVPVPNGDVGTNVLPMSVGTDNEGHAYVSDMVAGKIYKVNTNDGSPGSGAQDGSNEGDVPGLWADNDKYPLLGKPDSNNFLTGYPLCPQPDNGIPSCGFGVVEVMPRPNGEWLYYSHHEGNRISRIKIKADGSAGKHQTLDKVRPFALNGAYLDPVRKVIIAASPFTNFELGLGEPPRTEPRAHPAGALFVTDSLAKDAEIETLAIMELDDGMAVPVDAVSGRDVGSGHPDLLYVLDGSFDTLIFWPVGQPFDRPHHGAIRVIQLVDEDDQGQDEQ